MADSAALEVIAARAGELYGPRGSELNGSRIASVIGQLVSAGELAPGEQLPTVRALSRRLRVSPSTVSDAWRVLRAHAVISTDRRRGTIVRSTKGNVDGRYWHVPIESGTLAQDLSMGTPDPALLPSLAPALQKVQTDAIVTSYLDAPVVPDLHELLRHRWPFRPEKLTIVDGAQDGLDRIVSILVHLGDAVMVEDPTFPPIIDMLELAGARLVTVGSDREGPRVDDVARALEQQPVAAFFQPRAHNPTGVTMSAKRSKQLAQLIEGHPMVVVEDDHSGLVAGAELHSLGTYLPEQTVHIHSFSKSHGPDLRLAAVGGCSQVLDPVIRRRHLGPSWTSRLLQRVLLELLRDAQAEQAVMDAGRVYAERRAALLAELASRDIVLEPGSGMNVWVPVDNEQRAVVALAAYGIGAAPGRPFMVNPTDSEFIRLTIAAEVDDYAELADKIVLAAAAPEGRSRS